MPSGWAYWAALFFVIGLWQGLPHVTAASALLMLFIWLSRAYSRRIWRRLNCELVSSPTAVYPHDAVDLRVRVTNAKWLPLWGLRVGVGLPRDIEANVDITPDKDLPERMRYHFSLSIGWQERVTKKARIRFNHRGIYTIGPVLLKAADPLGLFPVEQRVEDSADVTVFPEPHQDPRLPQVLRFWLGEQARRKQLLDDPVFFAGLREYRPGDPLKWIDWKASARTGETQVRVFEESRRLDIAVLLDVRTYEYVWEGYSLETVESTISVAAAVAEQLLSESCQVSLSCNAMMNAGFPEDLESGSGTGQLGLAMRHLAAVLPYAGKPLTEYIEATVTKLPATTSLVIVTPHLPEDTTAWLTEHQDLRQRTLLLYVGHPENATFGDLNHLVVPVGRRPGDAA